jgi:hypothetical protein
MTLDELAGICRVTPQAVHGWVKAGMPVTRKGSRGRSKKTLVDFQAAMEWYFSENYERLELDRARARLANEQADKTAFDNAERARDLVPLLMIEREFGALLAEIRTNALALSSKLAPELEGLTIEERKAAIDRAVFDFLDRAAAWNPGSAASVGNESAPERAAKPAAPAASDDKPVGRRKKNSKRRGV